jgi:DNA primase large subunit
MVCRAPCNGYVRSNAGDVRQGTQDSPGEENVPTLQEQLGVYTSRDNVMLNRALHGYPMARLSDACQRRIDRLRAITDGGARDSVQRVRDASSVKTDQVTFFILAYACCVNQTHWFVQNEARSLMCKVESLTACEKLTVMQLLLVEVQSMHAVLLELEAIVKSSKQLLEKNETLPNAQRERAKFLQDLVRVFSTVVLQKRCTDITLSEWRSFHVIDFEHATRLVGRRGVTLHMGSAYVDEWQLSTIIRDTYVQQLTTFMQDCRRRFEEIGRSNTEYHFEQYRTILSIMHDAQWLVCPVVAHVHSGLDFTTQTLSMAIAEFAPLCIVKLAIKLRVHHHLVDKERVTLRLWLRAVKVQEHVAVEWWQQHVPAEEDMRGPISQAYAKQYACVGCNKIRTHGLCPFQDTDNNITSWCKANMPSAAHDIEDIIASTKCPQQRCVRTFELRYGDRASTAFVRPHNPANYFSTASNARLAVVESAV